MKAIIKNTIVGFVAFSSIAALAERVPREEIDRGDSGRVEDPIIHEPIDLGTVPPFVFIKSAVAAGSGCKSYPKTKLYGKQLLQLDMGRLEAVTGPYGSRSAFREFCQVAIDMEYPEGWTYAVKVAETKLQGYLESGTRATVGLVTYFQGSAATSNTSIDIYGPDQIYETIAGPLSETEFAPCNLDRALNVKQQVMIRGSRQAFGTLSIKGPTNLILVWKKCRY